MADATANRLIHATSPYLLQHAHNPVEWYPWGPEAIERARQENKPIFLSIGYSACHWCHVMEREVFEKQDIAALMNEHFVNIKVDREERPDLDDVYMLATQIMSGSGGWPMSVWLTPDLEPFYAGTYFPAEDGFGRPGFPRLERALADAWKSKEQDLRGQARRVVEAIRMHADESASGVALEEIPLDAWLHKAIEQNADRFDAAHGGFGGAPKFPPHQTLALFVNLLRKNPPAIGPQLSQITEMLTRTLDAMASGGIYDHVGGGFARYSTDQRWHVPHFEKMLYDNAQLAAIYATAATQLGRPDFARIARQTLDFWLREMTADSGAFYSTLDADSEGVEGKFYIWTLDEISRALEHQDDVNLIAEHFNITREGNWAEGGAGANVLLIDRSVTDLAAALHSTLTDLQQRIDGLCTKLRAARAQRVRPALDDKILTGWNGLMISALAVAGKNLDEPRYLSAARKALHFLYAHHVDPDGRLLRTSRGISNGDQLRSHTPAFLDDYACLLAGIIDLHEATNDQPLLQRAVALADIMLRDFSDARNGGFFFTGPQHEQLFARMKNAADSATPSANAVAVQGLLRLSQLTGSDVYRDAAHRAVTAFAPVIEHNPSWFPTMLGTLVSHEPVSPEPAEIPTPSVPQRPEISAPLALAPIALLSGRPGDTLTIAVTLRVAPGYHIQTNRPQDSSLIATLGRLRTTAPLTDQHWSYPTPQHITESGKDLVVYVGTVTLTSVIRISPQARSGSYPVRIVIEAQVCAGNRCLMPETLVAETSLVISE